MAMKLSVGLWGEHRSRKINKHHPKTFCTTQPATMKLLSAAKTAQVVVLLKRGYSGRRIERETGVSTGKISAIRKKHCPDLPKSSGGRPSKLSENEIRLVVRSITSRKVDTAPQAKRILKDVTNSTAGNQTIRRGLSKAGLEAKTKVKKPLLTPKHRRERLDWAIAHKEHTLEDWKAYIWSDETKINRVGSDGKKWVWVRKGEGLSDRRVQSTLKFGGGSVMIWGCMGWNGVGRAVKIDGIMDGDLYVAILEDDLKGSMEDLEVEAADIIFQQDNDPKHTCRKAKKWFKDNKIKTMPWPAQSPDLNPIEHLWQHCKSKLAEYENPPKGVLELWERVQDVWDEIDPSVCQKLIESMPRRIEAVIEAKGGHTKY